MIAKVLLIGIGASLGSLLRYGITHLLKWLFSASRWPVATLFINVSGSFLLGLFNAQIIAHPLLLAWLVAILGGYTTFSTYMHEVVELKFRNVYVAIGYYIGTAGLGLMAAGLGYWM